VSCFIGFQYKGFDMTALQFGGWRSLFQKEPPKIERRKMNRPVEIVPPLASWAEFRADHNKRDRLELRHKANAVGLPEVQMMPSSQTAPPGLLVTSEFDGDYDQLAQVVREQLPDKLGKQPVSLLLRTGGYAIGFEFKKMADALGIVGQQIAEPTAFEIFPDRIIEGVYDNVGSPEGQVAWTLPYHRIPLGEEKKDETKFLLQEYPHLKEMLVKTEWMVKDTRDSSEKSWMEGPRENHYPYFVYYLEIHPENQGPRKSVRGSRREGCAKTVERFRAERQGLRVH
jgi:hypothetical protein